MAAASLSTSSGAGSCASSSRISLAPGTPLTLTWTDVQNPQPEGYTLEISTDPKFANDDCAVLEYCNETITGHSITITSDLGFVFKSGTHYWRVRSVQGDASPLLPALTAWSPVGTFIVP